MLVFMRAKTINLAGIQSKNHFNRNHKRVAEIHHRLPKELENDKNHNQLLIGIYFTFLNLRNVCQCLA